MPGYSKTQDSWAQNAMGFRTQSQWIGLGTPLSINRKQFQFTHKWETLPSLIITQAWAKPWGFTLVFGKMFSSRKEISVTVSDLRSSDKHRSITVPLCKTGTPTSWRAWEILRGSWNRTGTGMEWPPCKKQCHGLRPFGLEKQWLKLSSAQQSTVRDTGSVGYSEGLAW